MMKQIQTGVDEQEQRTRSSGICTIVKIEVVGGSDAKGGVKEKEKVVVGRKARAA